MLHSIDNVLAGQVTYAVRSTNVDGFSLKEGDVIGLDNKKILAKGNSIDEVACHLIEKMKKDYHEVITLYYGKDVAEEDANALCAKVQDCYPNCEVDVLYGGQPIYYYFISLE